MSGTIAGIDRDELGRAAWDSWVGRYFAGWLWSDLSPDSQGVYCCMAEAVALRVEAAVRAEIAAETAAPVPAGITLDELRAELGRIETGKLAPNASRLSVCIRLGRTLMLCDLIARAEAKAASTPGADTTDDDT